MFFSRQPFMKREWLDYSNQARSSLTSSTLFDPGHRAAVLVCVLIYFLFGFPYALLMFAFCFGTYEVFEDDTIQEYMSYATPIQDKSI